MARRSPVNSKFCFVLIWHQMFFALYTPCLFIEKNQTQQEKKNESTLKENGAQETLCLSIRTAQAAHLPCVPEVCSSGLSPQPCPWQDCCAPALDARELKMASGRESRVGHCSSCRCRAWVPTGCSLLSKATASFSSFFFRFYCRAGSRWEGRTRHRAALPAPSLGQVLPLLHLWPHRSVTQHVKATR